MVLRRYVEHINSSTMPPEEVAALFGKPVRLLNLLLRPCTESPVPCHAEVIRYLVEAYPSINDVEGRCLWMNHLFDATQQTSPRFDPRGDFKPEHREPNTGNHRGFDNTGYEVELCYEVRFGFVSFLRILTPCLPALSRFIQHE